MQPTGKGPANTEGLDFYRRLVEGLCERGIIPMLTLYHWDLPQPLEDAGGWVERDTVNYFAEYAAIVAEALGPDVGMWITLNEPWCSAWSGYGSGNHAPGGRDIGRAAAATHHLLLAHAVALSVLRSEVPGAQVGITLNLTPVRSASDHPDDEAAARRVDGNMNRLFLEPLTGRGYPADMLAHYEAKEPGFSVVLDGDMELLASPIDFLGVNFYSPRTVASASRLAEANAAGYCVPNQPPDHVDTDLGASSLRRPGVAATEMGWEVEPGALQELLVRVNDEYARWPIYVTENGAACNDYVAPSGDVHDPERIRYLSGHLQAVLGSIEAGVEVRGYFVWSFLDNFEWAHGFSRRFGLAWVDFATGARIPKSSFAWYRDVVAANALPATEGL